MGSDKPYAPYDISPPCPAGQVSREEIEAQTVYKSFIIFIKLDTEVGLEQ
jgi:hypothetical protein